MNMLKQRRDYLQFGGKAEFNLKLTVIFTAGFSRILEVLNLGIKSVKNTWNLKWVSHTPKSCLLYCQGFTLAGNDISKIILQEKAMFFDKRC